MTKDAINWSEQLIAGEIARQTLAKRCLVLVDRCNWTGHECDLLAVTNDLRIIDVEIKISRADLKADARKEKWWLRPDNWRFTNARGGFALQGPPAPVAANKWPQRVWKHYYALPAEIWDDTLFDALPSHCSGVLLLAPNRGPDRPGAYPFVVKCVRRATPRRDAERLKPDQVMNIARLANLRMWDAYRSADRARRELMATRTAEAS